MTEYLYPAYMYPVPPWLRFTASRVALDAYKEYLGRRPDPITPEEVERVLSMNQPLVSESRAGLGAIEEHLAIRPQTVVPQEELLYVPI